MAVNLKDIKVGDVLIPRRWSGNHDRSDLAFLPDMISHCDQPQVVEEIDHTDGTIRFPNCIDGNRWWPWEHTDLARSSPGQRLARVQAAVGRLVATASGPDRLLQLQRRMVRATKAAADLVVEEVAKMGDS